MIKILKKVGLSFVLAGAFGVSANAICVVDNYCINLYAGLGGSYENMSGGGVDVNNLAGFISLGGSDLYFNRVQAGIDARLGYGSNSVSGVNLSSIKDNNQLAQIDVMAKIGLNISTKNSPLFLNIIGGPDLIMSSSGVGRELYYIGVGIDGKISMSEKFGLTYSAGWGYIYSGHYRIDGVKAGINGYNQLFMASLGTQIKMTENTSFYFKGFGKYYDLGSSAVVQVNSQDISMPTTKLWQAGVEAGIAF